MALPELMNNIKFCHCTHIFVWKARLYRRVVKSSCDEISIFNWNCSPFAAVTSVMCKRSIAANNLWSQSFVTKIVSCCIVVVCHWSRSIANRRRNYAIGLPPLFLTWRYRYPANTSSALNSTWFAIVILLRPPNYSFPIQRSFESLAKMTSPRDLHHKEHSSSRVSTWLGIMIIRPLSLNV